ncbi:hypothetical protein TM1040_3445 (plasmid) [Ruegeria sp. TM1040]|uniref:hypothetical protein n=1 Tax=Ruegeria sp. (strain TM1040) TaxID=292414 RepID=UPI0000556E06|nr:hypothetical protein [Ruegeria sp. TM1040]ABF62417.1 hypothetical protein TM1040_3445 [Ruegeria sp. TM1040]
MTEPLRPTGPLIRNLHSRRARQRLALAEAYSRTSILASLGRGLSDAVDFVRDPDDAFLVVLHNRLATASRAAKRANWPGGRLYNRLVGEDPNYVELSGSHIAHVLQLLGRDCPEGLGPLQFYHLRVDVVKDAIDVLTASVAPAKSDE